METMKLDTIIIYKLWLQTELRAGQAIRMIGDRNIINTILKFQQIFILFLSIYICLVLNFICLLRGVFLGGSDGKDPACTAGDLSSIPG